MAGHRVNTAQIALDSVTYIAKQKASAVGSAAKKDVSENAAKLIAKDDFSKANPELWEIGSGQWKHEKGVLTQSLPGEERRRIQLKPTVPADFAATFKFTFTGGEPWRSVGLSFDVAGENEVLVYASANTPAPKLQISYKQGGNYAYPTEGMKARPFKVGDTVELTIRVRGLVINVAVNDEHAFAYRLPIPRKAGAIELITYAATAEFRAFELSELPADFKLVEAGGAKVPITPEQARLALAVAVKAQEVAESEISVLKARFAAERGKYAKAADAGDMAKAAAKAEKQVALLTA